MYHGHVHPYRRRRVLNGDYLGLRVFYGEWTVSKDVKRRRNIGHAGEQAATHVLDGERKRFYSANRNGAEIQNPLGNGESGREAVGAWCRALVGVYNDERS
jgi:hypothetical protein